MAELLPTMNADPMAAAIDQQTRVSSVRMIGFLVGWGDSARANGSNGKKINRPKFEIETD